MHIALKKLYINPFCFDVHNNYLQICTRIIYNIHIIRLMLGIFLQIYQSKHVTTQVTRTMAKQSNCHKKYVAKYEF